jgi:hypothetical protein
MECPLVDWGLLVSLFVYATANVSATVRGYVTVLGNESLSVMVA